MDKHFDQLYRLYCGNEPENEWIICGGNVILWVKADWELTEEQIKMMLHKIS